MPRISESLNKIASLKMCHAFAEGVPTGTGAQPTGKNFSSEFLGWPHTRGGAAGATSIDFLKNSRATHIDQGGRDSYHRVRVPGPGILQAVGGIGGGDHGERLLHGVHLGAGRPMVTRPIEGLWPGK